MKLCIYHAKFIWRKKRYSVHINILMTSYNTFHFLIEIKRSFSSDYSSISFRLLGGVVKGLPFNVIIEQST